MYQKLTEVEDEVWLLRASERTFLFHKAQLGQNSQAWCVFSTSIRLQRSIDIIYSTLLGLSLLHLAIDGSTPEFRRTVISTVSTLALREPELLISAISTALAAHLVRDKPAPKADANGEESEKSVNKDARLPALFLACATFKEDYETSHRERLLAKLIVVGHHRSLCK